MSISERKTLHKASIKQAILDFAEEVATLEGWDAVTMRRISSKIEYALPVIYTHFKNKEAIISTLARKGFIILLSQLEATLKSEPENIENSTELALVYINFAKTHKALYQAMYGQSGISSFLQGNLNEGEKVFDLIHNYLIYLVAEKQAKIADPLEATKLIWATLHGLITLDNINQITEAKIKIETVAINFIKILMQNWELL